MPISLQFAIRWLSYPLVFGGSAACMIWALYAGVPYWPRWVKQRLTSFLKKV